MLGATAKVLAVHTKRIVRLLIALSLLAWQPSAMAAPSISAILLESVDRPTAARNDGGLLHRVSVVGKDQRKLLPDMVDVQYRKAADSVGIIVHSNGFSCTAFCVASNIIATNAHCVANKVAGKQPIDLNQSQFRLSTSNRGIHRLFSRFKIADYDQPLASVYTGVMNGRFTRATLHRDWAFVKLSSPVCANYSVGLADVPKPGVVKAAKAKKVFLIGYHGDKKMKGKWLSDMCSIVAGRRARSFRLSKAVARQHMLLHTCDATKGASGSPIFMQTDDGHAVVGINSGNLTFTRYRRNLRTGKRKTLSRKITNTAVKSSAFVRGFDRFRAEDSVRTAEEMRRLQERLRQGGFLKGRADGQFGPATRRAIRRLEDRRKMAPLGLPTLALLHDLEREAEAREKAEREKKERRAEERKVRERDAEKRDTVEGVVTPPAAIEVPPLPVLGPARTNPLSASKPATAAPSPVSKPAQAAPPAASKLTTKRKPSRKRRLSRVQRKKRACMTFNQCVSRCRVGELKRDRLNGAYCGHTCSNEVQLC